MHFRVRYFDPVTRTAHRATIEASSIAAAGAMLADRGQTVLDVKPAVGLFAVRSRIDLRLFCRELASLLKAGMTIVEALEALSARGGKHANVKAFQAVLRYLREGRSLSQAMEDCGLPFPPILVAAVRSSERSGRIAEALAEYLQYADLLRESRRRAINAAIYPLLVVGLGLVVTLFLLGFVVPRFARIYDDFHGDISVITRTIMTLAQFVSHHGIESALTILGLACAAVALALRPSARRLALATLLRVRWFAGLVEHMQLARIHRTIAMLLRGGFPVTEAVALAHGLAFEKGLSERLLRAKQQISEGGSIGASFSAQRLVDEVGTRLIAVGERNGQLDTTLDVIAQELQLSVDTRIERLMRLLEPLLIFGVALMIGAIVVMMYLPIFDLAGGIN